MCVMDFREQGLSIEEAKQIDLVDYLSKLGYSPSKIINSDHWYLSPLREEKTPSFKVNRNLNRWYDHGLGKGGNIIDFAILYNNCTVGELLKNLNDNLSFRRSGINNAQSQQEQGAESKIHILQVKTLSSFSLLNYLQQRRIPVDLAEQFCKEVKYELNGKEYFGIGFKNDAGGYEIRNPYFKASSSPKEITTFSNNEAKEAAVFEGFTDFLSFLAINKNEQQVPQNFMVLNSLSFFEKARVFMEQNEAIRLYLDRDAAGQNCSRYAVSLSNKYKDESRLYQQYKDLNDWVVNFGKTKKKKLRQKLS